jgi:hypothetical protein
MERLFYFRINTINLSIHLLLYPKKLEYTLTKLSVNINKWATLRNARGDNNPDILKTVKELRQLALMKFLI